MHFIGHYDRLLAVECFESKFDNAKKFRIHIKGTGDKPSNKGRGFKVCTEERDVECFESKFDNAKKFRIHIKGTGDKPSNKGRGFKVCTEERDAIKMTETISRGRTLYTGRVWLCTV